jgi:hypothetical protein
MGQTRQELETRYVSVMGDYARLYIGKVEVPYERQFYKTLPYLYEDGSFHVGTVGTEELVYPEVALRFDVYLNQLVVESPYSHVKVVPRKENVQFFTLEGQRFVNCNGTFVREEYAGKKLSLFTYIYKEHDYPDIQQARKMVQFKSKWDLWLVQDGKVKTVKSLSDLQALLPTRSQEIKRFADEKKLKFNTKNRINSVKSIVEFLDS